MEEKDWYREALRRIADWPEGYEEIVQPEIDSFARDVLDADDPEQAVKDWRKHLSGYRRQRRDWNGDS
jgi:hypothetical protein